jgi:pyruvate formate lyase activating enzyme
MMDAYIHEILLENQLVIIKFSGCDYKCKYCDVPHLVEFTTGETMTTREAATMISSMAKERVLFTGGEPLLQRQALIELLTHCKAQGFTTIVDTNASKPDTIKLLLEKKLVDEFQVDLKATAASFDKVTKAATFFKPAAELYKEFTESLAHLAARPAEVKLSFSTIIVPGLLYKKEELLEMAARIEKCDGEWQLLPFKPETTLDPTLQGVSPPTEKFLATLQSFIKKEYPNVQVSILE